MTALYEVRTGHTEEVLEAFAKLTTSQDSGRVWFRFGVIALIFFTIPRAVELPRQVDIMLYIIGALVLVTCFLRPQMALYNLKSKDRMYIDRTIIHMVFGHSAFTVDDGQVNKFQYGRITNMFIDKDMYYIQIDGEDLYIVPKAHFIAGDSEEFGNFIQTCTGKDFGGVNLSFKEKMKRLGSAYEQANKNRQDMMADIWNRRPGKK